jgi:orotate phosphoribosyltransferase
MNNDVKYIREIIVNKCIITPSHGIMFGKLPGARYQHQYYLANGLYDQEFLHAVAREFYRIVSDRIGHFNFQITGREWSACPLITGLPIILKHLYGIELNSFLIKRKRKTYGTNNIIEGIPNQLPVLIVDDLCNSTNSFYHCSRVLKHSKIPQLEYIFAVVNKQSEEVVTDKYLNDKTALFIISGDQL